MLHAFIITLYNMEIANVSCGKIPYNTNVYEIKMVLPVLLL